MRRLLLADCNIVGLPLFAASGDEVVLALTRGGFRVLSQTSTTAVLERGYRRIVVARGRVLEPGELIAILRASGVPYSLLLEWLDEPRQETSVRRRTLRDEDGPAPPTKPAR